MKHTLLILFAALLAFTTTTAQTTPDPGLPGPLAVTKAQYDLGDLAATLPSFPSAVEVRGSVHYPTGLAGGPYPVIFLLHGRHSTCYNTSSLAASSAWPCPTGRLPIVSYEGYDYFARNMASRGYIVISISCNAINAGDASLADYGQNARGELVQYHMRLWDTINTTGRAPFGTTFVGKLNMQNIGTMGHSRGGEGVIMNALLNKSLGSPFGIKAIITLAPVDFLRKAVNGIPVMNIAPYCDGDVSNLQGVRYYDDARYLDSTDETPKYSVLMMGADHNFYNTVWTPGSYIAGGVDDWTYVNPANTAAYCGLMATSSKRFDTTKQKAAYNCYASAFFRIYLGGETQFKPILDVRDIIPPASSMLDTTNCYVSYHPGRSDRRDVNRGDTVVDVTTNTMGAVVTSTGMATSTICGGGLSMASCNIASTTTQEPHRGTTTAKGLAQIHLIWNDTTDWYQNDIPANKRDLRFVHSLQFRAAQNYSKCTTNQKLNFTVQLIDSAGAVASQLVSGNSKALFYQPGNLSGTLPKVLFNTIRIPIANFTGINKKNVQKIRFLFNKFDSGAILVSDIAFLNQCGTFSAKIGSAPGTGHNILFKDTLTGNSTDTLTWLWNFGDPAGGTGDTSTAHNPTHNYSAPGTYTACVYVQIKCTSGNKCFDTVCKTVTVLPPTIIDYATIDEINIYPNPASNMLYITGAAKTDVLRLENTLGQTVLTTTLNSTTVQLPISLANGMYYAVIHTDKGTVYKKIIVSR